MVAGLARGGYGRDAAVRVRGRGRIRVHSGQKTVTIEDNHGQIEVPVNPERVVALDNTVFQTLSDWGCRWSPLQRV